VTEHKGKLWSKGRLSSAQVSVQKTDANVRRQATLFEILVENSVTQQSTCTLRVALSKDFSNTTHFISTDSEKMISLRHNIRPILASFVIPQ
jgi:hypothetical protein